LASLLLLVYLQLPGDPVVAVAVLLLTFETAGLGLSDYDYRTSNFFCYRTIDYWINNKGHTDKKEKKIFFVFKEIQRDRVQSHI
jgi:hypothetical protein